MAIKISNCLDAALALTTFDLTKEDIRHSYLDYAALTILRDESSIAYQELRNRLHEWELQQLPTRIAHLITEQPDHEQLSPKDFFSDIRRQLLNNSKEQMVTSLHLLRLIVARTATATSQVLSHFGITAHSFAFQSLLYSHNEFEQADNQMANSQEDSQSASNNVLDPIEKYATDLTKIAEEGKFDPVIGRDDDIARLMQILCRRKKNNPILIGDAGVGKSAIVEALAVKISSQHVPQPLQNKRLYSLNVAALIAGTKYRGEFEQRMQQFIDELQHRDDIILFIDEIHTIAGAGATQGSLDIANILKPALARGDIRLIGATTHDEYRKYIEGDASLERRFQRVTIEPTSIAQTLDILRQIAPNYEQHHGIHYTEDALRACVELSERYINERHLPDKAIDLLDEAGAYAHQMTNSCLPPTAHVVDRADIERIITRTTGIPVEQLSLNEREKIKHLPRHLKSRVVGQREAIDQLAKTLLLHKSGLRQHNRPIGVFLFAGPTGVGKTLLAKELSAYLFNNDKSLIRIDMSECGERHSISRLIGSPPGYVGYGEGGQLSEAVRRQPYAVVLLDEIEKAHPDVLNLMLQIFDEGHLTDGAGRRIDFKNTIIILTSNIGANTDTRHNRYVAGFNTPSKQENTLSSTSEHYHEALEKNFAPEFLNRIDRIICFRNLTTDDALQIIDIELGELISRSNDLGYRVNISANVKQHLAQIGFLPRYGARTLRRAISSLIEEPLSRLIVEEEIERGNTINISLCEEEIQLKVA